MSKVADALRASPLLAHGDRVLVACSGGADSLALLHALYTLRDELALENVAAAHLHHGLRGNDADADCRFVEEFCASRGILCITKQADVPALARARKLSIEMAARDARYAFLEEAATAFRANKIAVAHTADDQVETLLLHILRGTGLDGLRGIPVRRALYIRPLLEVTRVDVEQYCAAHGLMPRHDATNWDTDGSMRSRVRHKLLPVLEQEYNLSVRDALLRLSQTASRDADFLHAEANKALAECVLHHNKGQLTMNADALRSLHPSLVRRVLRAAVLEVRGTMEGVTFEHIELLCAALESGGEKGLTLPAPCQCAVRVGTTQVTVSLPITSSVYVGVRHALPVPGEVALGEWMVRAYILPVSLKMPTDPFIACLDADRVDVPSLVVRTAQAGDRIAPLGMHGHTQKVSRLLANAKVPFSERQSLPIIADGSGLLWIAGHTLAEHARLLPETQHALRLCALCTPASPS